MKKRMVDKYLLYSCKYIYTYMYINQFWFNNVKCFINLKFLRWYINLILHSAKIKEIIVIVV